LVAKHDTTGKAFNVGEVVGLEDGSVKSKEALAIIEERKAQEEAERAANEPGIQAGFNPERASQIQGLVQEKPKKAKISNKQLKRQAALQPRPPPPRPVLPERISLPEGEENFIALWDITDEEIHKRMSNEKRIKSAERKNLRRKQKEEKRFNQAMKLLKRQTENRGEKWDPVKGSKVVLKQQEDEGPEEDSQDSVSDDDSESEDVKVEEPVKPVKAEKESKKSKKSKKGSKPTSNGDVVQVSAPEPQPKEKKSKRPAEDYLVEEPKAKRSKKPNKSTAGHVEEVQTPAPTEPEPQPEPAATEKKKKKSKDKKFSLEPAAEADPELKVKANGIVKEKKRAKKEKKRQGKEIVEAAKAAAAQEKSSEKRKLEDDEAEIPIEKEKSHKKKKAKSEESGSAEQWNPDALAGDAARKEKFLRLLGAGKTNAAATNTAKHKSSAKVEDITKVQSELVRQYEAGMKMKHDGGARRRGLGA
jgi:hypothetical protein